jgi:hypothetical protein
MTPRLGKRPPHPAAHPHHRVKLTGFLAPSLIAPPICDWTGPVASFDAYGNETIGDCAIAAPLNAIRLWTAHGGAEKDLPLSVALSAYTLFGGYDPVDPSTDGGCIISNVLAGWHAQSVGIGGDVLAAFAEVDHSNEAHLKLSTYTFGATIVGVQLPVSAQGAASWETPLHLDGDNAPGSWGGHCVPIVGYNAEAALVVSWGRLLPMTWGFFAAYGDEAWAPVSTDWLSAGTTPAGVDLPGLLSAMHQIEDT